MNLVFRRVATHAVLGAFICLHAAAETGLVLFNNSKIAQPVFYANGTKITSANYVAQLFYSTDGTSFSALSTPAPFNTVPAKAGYWSGNTKNLELPSPVHDNQELTLKVVIWDLSLFSSWDAAVRYSTGFLGLPFCTSVQLGSETFQYTTPAVDNLAPEAAYMKNFTSFALKEYKVCPEPSVLSCGLGGLVLLCCLRRGFQRAN